MGCSWHYHDSRISSNYYHFQVHYDVNVLKGHFKGVEG